MYKFVDSKHYKIACPLGVIYTNKATQKQLKYLFGRNLPFADSIKFVEKKKKVKVNEEQKENK